MKWKLAALAFVTALVLAHASRADDGTFVGARTFVMSQDFIRNEDHAKLCFVSKGGVEVRAYDNACPVEKTYQAEESGILKRLGARRNLLRGYTVIFTRHMIFSFDVSTREFMIVNGVTHTGQLRDGTKVALILVGTHKTTDCTPRITLRHELGHAIFIRAAYDSSFLDHAPDSTPCDFSDNHLLEQVVMILGKELPRGPIRDQVKAAKP